MDDLERAAFIDNSAESEWSSSRVLWKRLRKLCLWHIFLLKAVDSPFLNKGDVAVRDLRIAVGICQLQPFQSKIRKPVLAIAWIYTKCILRGIFLSRRKRRRMLVKNESLLDIEFAKHVKAFGVFVGDYIARPEFAVIPPQLPGGKSIPMEHYGQMDETIRQAATLIGFGLPEQRAWSMPLGMANFYFIAALQHQGATIDIVDEEERKFREQIAQANARKIYAKTTGNN